MILLNKAKQRIDTDGLKSIEYKVVKIKKLPLYTHIMVSYNQIEILTKNKAK